MYLFTKRTRNIIKGIWAVLAILVIVSMIIAYSGFTMLPGTSPTMEARDVSPEDLIPSGASSTLDVSNLSTSSPEIQELLKSIQEDMETGTTTGTTPVPEAPSMPPAPELNFGI